MERKRKLTIVQKRAENFSTDTALEKENFGEDNQSPNINMNEREMGVSNGIIGNPGTILKEVVNLKQQM